MKYLLGMDIGTTNMKGVLYSETGDKIAFAQCTYEIFHRNQDCAEQKPSDWWNSAVSIFREIINEVDSQVKEQIVAICISSQTPTLLPVTKDGTPLRDAIIWMDKRADQEMKEILQTMGEERYISVTGMLPAVSFLPPKLLWYKKQEKALFEKTACFLQANGYINYKLTNVFSMDLDQASLTQCLNATKGEWSKEIGETIGIALEQYFPKPLKNHQIIGYVTKEAAKETGLPVNMAVVAGSSDAIAAMYASGLTTLGEATEVSGTSSLVFAGTKKLPKDYHSVGGHKCALQEIPYVYNAPISATGASIKWYLKNFGQYEYQLAKEKGRNVYDILNEEALQAKPGSNGLIFFPYMMGERAPLWNNHARGMFIGLSMDSKREDMVRGIFEGTSFALKSVIEECRRNGTKIDKIRVVGGGALSDTWLQIKASVLNIPVLVLDKKTGDVPFGDALIAGQAVGLYKDLSQSIKDIVTVERVIEPKEEWAMIYDKQYEYFKKFYQDLDSNLKAYAEIWKQ